MGMTGGQIGLLSVQKLEAIGNGWPKHQTGMIVASMVAYVVPPRG